MGLSGIELSKLNQHVDFKGIEVRYMHKLLKGNFAIIPSLTGTFIFALLGKPDGIKKIMTSQTLFGLHYIDYENYILKFDSDLYAENTLEWFKAQMKLNGFKEVRQFIRWGH